MSDQQTSDMIRDSARQAKGTIAETAETVRNTAMEASGRAQEMAREAGRQATAAAQNLYGQSGVALDTVERLVVENPWGAILIAGAVGYGLACLVKQR
ncbi:MAG: hypothetical protein JO032_06220 [Alphaproteobacteria bacterium]|nr:hypothetical protein [Alphaproteobacteria bacterium]MBV9552372.1 hypothetical protein [Alphaproteobacteria bacterium]